MGENFRGKKIQMFSDNQAIYHVINAGKSNCTVLQDCLREIAFLAACYEFQVRMVHLSSESNMISDHLRGTFKNNVDFHCSVSMF